MNRIRKEQKKQKSISLFQLFLRQMVWLAMDVFLEILLAVILFVIALQTNFILPANYAQNYISLHEQEIVQSKDLKKAIPAMCTYGSFDENKVYIEGNFSKDKQIKAKQILTDSNANNSFYHVLQKGQGYLVIYDDLSVHFKNETLDRLFPQIEKVFRLLIFCIFLLLIVLNAYFFGKKLKKQLAPVLKIIELIGQRELDFEEETSKIKEINAISHALFEMKTALSESLLKEWKLEQQKRNNIRALAHDIKTPLTIIKGNAQLILEETDLKNIHDSAGDMDQNADRIEEYLKLLMDEMQPQKEKLKKQEILYTQFMYELEQQIRQLCAAKETACRFEMRHDMEQLPETITLYTMRVYRAILNIVSNAVEYGGYKKEQPLIAVIFSSNESYFFIEVKDNGVGFSKEALQHAKEQFFTTHKERQQAHYGMGLSFANDVAMEHGGYLQIQNQSTHGASVVIAIAR